MEALGDAVVFGESPHAGDGFHPVSQGVCEGDERVEATVGELVDDTE